MNAVVTGLIQRSFYGGVLILVIITLRSMLLDKLPKRTFPVLWGVAIVRLMLPFSFSSMFSVYSFLQKGTGAGSPDYVSPGIPGGTVITGNAPMWTTMQHLTLDGRAPVISGRNPFPVLPAVWCAGAAFSAVFFAVSYLRCLRGFRTSVPAKGGRIQRWLNRHRSVRSISVRESDQISAPLTYGILRPVILLPGRLSWENRPELEYILQHEYVHICRYDAAVKLAMVATLCLHWFNPLVWIMSGLLNRDIELACDEEVLRRFGEQSRAGYAMALIGMEEKKRSLMPLYNGFSKNAIEERIRLIMKYKKMTYITIVSALLLVLTVALVFATSARRAEAAGPLDDPGTEAGAPMGDQLPDAPKIEVDSPEENGGTENPEDGNPLNPSAQGDEGSMFITYMTEGLPVDVPADLYQGKGYCILIPKDGWRIYAPDAWMVEFNDQIQVWVSDYSGYTWEQVVASLEENGYSQTDEDGILRKESSEKTYVADIRRSGDLIKCLNYTYPANPEYEEGFGRLLSAIAINFAVLPEENAGDVSEDGKQVQNLAFAFWEAYRTGDAEAMKQYLAADYTGSIDIFPDGADGHIAEEAHADTVKGADIENKAIGEKCEIWVEFRPAAGADYLEYLEMAVIKEQDGWKVLSYGLER